MERIIKPALNIQSNEITRLMQTFWGEENPITVVSGQIESFDSTLEILKSAKAMEDKAKGKSYVITNLTGKKISFGIRAGEELIAHSGLTVKQWGEVECGGAVIAQEYRDRSLMGGLNENRRALLREFVSLDFQLTSFLLLGSNSIYYGASLFDFEDLNVRTYFCNIGPYVYNRPLTTAQLDRGRLADLSLRTETTAISSSTQIIGVHTDNPPRIAKGLTAQLPQLIKDFIEGFPVLGENYPQKVFDVENSARHSPAKIAIHIIRKPFKNEESFLSDLNKDIRGGNSIIVQVPLQNGSDKVIKQMTNITGKDYGGVMLIPTGLTIVDGYWSLTFASILGDRLPHYKYIMESILKGYTEESLRKLAFYSLNAMNSL